ncbi:MAG TPA: zinc-dependent metalloprotease, partial [Marmoricola sp.]|nr:zinc-dependent metalloprotease [Marmoricola sp.]
DPQEMLSEVTEKVADLISGKTQGSLMELFATPRQRELLDQITGVMSLLEGHADVVMDGVGPSVIPSVEKIRAKFTERRKGMGMLDKIIRRLLGLDQKMAQYRDGAIFVRYAVDKVGMAGFNRVWERPENLPSKAEILDPQSWLDRVHGPKLLEA